MSFEIALTVIIGVAIVFLVLSFMSGLYMFNVALLPKSPKNILKKKKKDVPDEIKAFYEESYSWALDNTNSIWSITTFDDLKLKARYIKGPNTHIWVILLHGYTSEGWHMAGFAEQYLKNGFSILMPDLRAHGQSEGQHVTMGYYESVDVIEWIYEIIRKDPKAQIVLHGISMGAATAMMVTGEDLPEQVKCVIEDCGYTSLWEEYKYYIRKNYKLPTFPVLYAANIISSARIKVDFNEVSPLEAVKCSKIPTLFIHGDQDTLVPFYMLDTLYENAACEKDKLVIPGAAHGEASSKDSDTYNKKVSEFIKKYIN